MASPCFLFRFPRMDSCWMLASSTSLRSLFTSASLFLFSSTWAVVAPLASSRRSPRESISLAKSDLCLSALDLLNSLLGLCHEVLLVIELGGQLGVVLVL